MTPLPVPCPPCLRALLEGRADRVHEECELTTVLTLDGARLTIGPEANCPCRCPLPGESAALQAARAEARQRTS
ncbi:hypothetical protein [Streptomyces sp. NPDC087300]|uniref:hypothetical protein n=1 Tax=Streptomyces sp. NPDC087300 TaxID=3365780 RepID=UPI003807FC5C